MIVSLNARGCCRCAHCKQMAAGYERLAVEKKTSMLVLRCDATREAALAARFDVRSFPTIFHLSKGREVRKYNGRRSFEDMSAYVDGQWRHQERLSLWASPYGPIGRLKGLIISAGTSMIHAYAMLLKLGLSQFAAGFVIFVAWATVVLVVVLGLASLGGEDPHPHAA